MHRVIGLDHIPARAQVVVGFLSLLACDDCNFAIDGLAFKVRRRDLQLILRTLPIDWATPFYERKSAQGGRPNSIGLRSRDGGGASRAFVSDTHSGGL